MKNIRMLLSALVLFVLTALVCVVPASAAKVTASGVCGPDLRWELSSDGCLTLSGSGVMDDYTYQTVPWADYREQIKNVSLPKGLTGIGCYAFSGLHADTVIIPDTVTQIGNYAFAYSYLTECTIPDSVQKLGECLFSYSDIRYARLPEGITGIPESTFNFCAYLESVDIPESVTKIGGYAFSNCIALKEIPHSENITYLGRYAFVSCDMLESFTLSPEITYFGGGAFAGCSSLTLVYPSDTSCTYTTDRYGAIYLHQELVYFPPEVEGSFRVPEDITAISMSAFTSSRLSELILPENLFYIGFQAFYEMPNLERITIPDSVRNIGRYLFCSCTSLREVVLGSGITSIGDSDYSGCTALERIVIPDTVKEIGSDAFYGCCSLKDIDFPSSLESIGVGAFYECASLERVILPDSLKTLEESAFMRCYSLKEVRLSSALTEIKELTFYHNDSLKTITIPAGVVSIAENAFGAVMSMEEILCESNRFISRNGFLWSKDGTLLTAFGTLKGAVTVPDGIRRIGEEAFHYCCEITEVTLPASVTELADYAFFVCPALEKLTFLGDAPAHTDQSFEIYCDEETSFLCNGDGKGWTFPEWTSVGGKVFPTEKLNVLPGDMNHDGSVTAADAVFLLRSILFPDEYPSSVTGKTEADAIQSYRKLQN